jgi:hypothetical protein
VDGRKGLDQPVAQGVSFVLAEVAGHLLRLAVDDAVDLGHDVERRAEHLRVGTPCEHLRDRHRGVPER